MILRKIIPILIVYSCLSLSAQGQTAPPSAVAHIQDFSEIVVPIASVRLAPSVRLGVSGMPVPRLGIGGIFGTGFCLDAECHFIVTNYHVAAIARPRKIKREKVVNRYFATGPNDKGATANNLGDGGVLPYVMKQDLAMFELRRSLPHHHGVAYSLDELQVGQEVDIYGFPRGINNNVIRARELAQFPATFKGPTTSGLLAFEYDWPTDPARVRGASGGIVVDRKTKKIVGILSETNDTTAVAVSVQTLVDFVSKVQPFLAQRIFATNVLSVSADLYPKFAPPADYNAKYVPGVAFGLQRRPEEPPEVRLLRDKAQGLADSIRNYMAVQSFEWGSGHDDDSVAEAEFQVRVVDGAQTFRKYPDGKREYEQVPYPNWGDWILPTDDWSKLPKMVGTEFRLKVRQAADVVVNGRRMKVFQYYASVEDKVCSMAPVENYGFFSLTRKTVVVACYGEVWTDADTNIIRISQSLELSDKLTAYRGWEDLRTVVTYNWLKRASEPPRLVPLTIFTEARYKKKQVNWCRGQFTHYQVFDSDVRITANEH